MKTIRVKDGWRRENEKSFQINQLVRGCYYPKITLNFLNWFESF